MTESKDSGVALVSLKAVVDEMDLPSEEWTAYLNRRTGELITVTDEDQRLVENDADASDSPEWQQESVARARTALDSEDFLALPDKFEIHEHSIMERFCLGVEESALKDTLLRAIRGTGAFRRFKDVVHEHGIAETWYAFRQKALEEIAVEWLEANGVAYSRD